MGTRPQFTKSFRASVQFLNKSCGDPFLTAVLELHPTRRKAAAIDRVRATAEGVFWAMLAGDQAPAEAIAGEADGKRRCEAWRTMQRPDPRGTRQTVRCR